MPRKFGRKINQSPTAQNCTHKKISATLSGIIYCKDCLEVIENPRDSLP